VAEACRAAGIARWTAYRRERQRSERFALAWADAEQEITDALEAEAYRRALDGSDRLLMFLLRALRPEKYSERYQLQHSRTVAHGVDILGGKDPIQIDPEKRRKIAEIFLEEDD
jgi:hypothetical protein